MYKDKLRTDDNYNNALRLIIQEIKNRNGLKLLVATHNNESINLALNLSTDVDDYNKIGFAQLLGMNDTISNELIKNGKIVYKYVPYGNINEILPYLMRRLYENSNVLKHI